MKFYTRRKSIFLALVMVVMLVSSCFTLIACKSSNSSKISNDSGFVIEGGDFEKGSTLVASLVDSESEEWNTAVAAIGSYSYDKTKPVYVFDVSVVKDGKKVQPNGKVKVTIPVNENLTGYEVLHIKDDNNVERLKITYSNGVATFETSSFSKFVFVKKVSSSEGGNDSGNEGAGDDNTTKYSFKAIARRIVPASFSEGGTVRDIDDEDVAYVTQNLAEGTEYTVKSYCYPDYYFVGWYEASEREEANEDTFISSNPTYTFTINRNLNVLALYAHKTDAVEFRLQAKAYGFSYRNGEPTVTIVPRNSENTPNYEDVDVMAFLGDGSAKNYGSNNSTYFSIDNGGLDYSKVGTYTITYSYRYNSNIKASLKIKVVDSAHTLSVSTSSDNLKFRYNASYERRELEEILPEGRLVTLSAEPKDGYAFTGWYDQNENLVSNNLVYCFEMPNSDVSLHGKYEASTISLTFTVLYDQGELVDEFGNGCTWSGTEKVYFKAGENVSLTVREKSYYEFLGWYDVADGKSDLITSSRTLTLTLNESKKVTAMFREKIKYIEIDSTTLTNESFVNGMVGFAIGDSAIDYRNFEVKAAGVTGSYNSLSSNDYTIDDSSVDFNTAGTYTITYTYKYDTNIKTKLKIVVVDPQNAQFEFVKGKSYLDHEYDGKATFISLKDIKVSGISLYDFKSTSKIWEKISYKWIDKRTNQEVETEGVDITINGTVVKNYGPENDKMTIGNEFGGPIKAGAYRFEFIYNGETKFTKDSTITTQTYRKITSSEEFKTNEGSTWINFELYYYTIIGYADGKYYVMQMPSIGTSNYEAEAREISVDSNGNALVGEGNDFAFVYARYFASDTTYKRMEFLTGYYGSYVVNSSSNTTDGTMFGSPYIYRTGHTYLSDGKICREYGTKSSYGMVTKFDEDGSVSIYSINSSANSRLRLVKDGSKYVFTSVDEDTDTRTSFDIFIYRTIIEENIEESNK